MVKKDRFGYFSVYTAFRDPQGRIGTAAVSGEYVFGDFITDRQSALYRRLLQRSDSRI